MQEKMIYQILCHIMKIKFELKIFRKGTVKVFYLNSTLNFGIPPVLVFQLEVYYKVDRLLSGLTAKQKGTTSLHMLVDFFVRPDHLLSLFYFLQFQHSQARQCCRHNNKLLVEHHLLRNIHKVFHHQSCIQYVGKLRHQQQIHIM